MTPDRRKLLIGAGIAVAMIAAGVYYFVLRDARSECQRFVGDLAELEKLTGTQLAFEYHYSGKYHCSQTVSSRGADRTTTIVSLEVTDARDLRSIRERLDRDGFVRSIPLAISDNAVLFVAGDTALPTTEQLAADARQRAARGSRDGIGDALAALPPSKHVVLFAIGGRMTQISLDRGSFTVDQAMAYADSVAKRVRD